MQHSCDVVVLAENQPLCSEGLLQLMRSSLHYSEVISCSDLPETEAALRSHKSRVSLLVIDYDLPGLGKEEGMRRICQQHPSIRVLVVCSSCDRDTVVALLAAGVHGLTSRSGSKADLQEALSATAAGQVFVPRLVAADDEPIIDHCAEVREDVRLTERQREVLGLVAAGNSNKEIARALKISEGTVKVHIHASFRALGVHNRVKAAAALWAQSVRAEGHQPALPAIEPVHGWAR